MIRRAYQLNDCGHEVNSAAPFSVPPTTPTQSSLLGFLISTLELVRASRGSLLPFNFSAMMGVVSSVFCEVLLFRCFILSASLKSKE
jgi:hypothetical protein